MVEQASVRVLRGDCVQVMREMPAASVDSVVCDPPYELGFMGKSWDATGVAYRVETWIEALRVLKPGGYLLAFGGTRTYHRLACAIEDAGFEIRDTIQWIYGSGFPKSHNISKAVDKLAGVKREDTGELLPGHTEGRNRTFGTNGNIYGEAKEAKATYTIPATEEAKRWEGWGSALKPAHEPIVMARKPLSEKSLASNVLEWGTGGLNIDQSRIGWQGEKDKGDPNRFHKTDGGDFLASDPSKTTVGESAAASGRWPSNLLLSHSEGCQRIGSKRVPNGRWAKNKPSTWRPDKGGFSEGWGERLVEGYADPDGTEEVAAWECVEGCVVKALDEESGECKTGGHSKRGKGIGNGYNGSEAAYDPERGYDDTTPGASRFFKTFPGFYCAKASRAERNRGLEGMPPRIKTDIDPDTGEEFEYKEKIGNTHPTVKSLSLMRYLCKLVTQRGGTVLDPFAGSGTTGVAALSDGFNTILIEQDESYADIAEARCAHALNEVSSRLPL